MGQMCSQCYQKDNFDMIEGMEVPPQCSPNQTREIIPVEPALQPQLNCSSQVLSVLVGNPSSMFIPKSQQKRHNNIPVTPPSMITNTIFIKRLESQSNHIWIVPEFASTTIQSQEMTRYTQYKKEEKIDI